MESKGFEKYENRRLPKLIHYLKFFVKIIIWTHE